MKGDPQTLANAPVTLMPFLTTNGSLTALLEQQAGRPITVERSFEGYLALSLEQKKQLGVAGAQLNRPMLAWVRSTYLYGTDQKPWVAAQSIFPITSLKGTAKRLQQLKGMPIGYVLFKRSRTLPNERTIYLSKLGWQRQTRYDWFGRKFLISETFLPAFCQQL